MGTAPSLSRLGEHYSSILSSDSVIDLSGCNDAWTPKIIEHRDMFYCFYSVPTFGTRTSVSSVGTVESFEPSSWTGHGQVIQRGNGTGIIPYSLTNAINPTVFIGPTNRTAYLNYSSFCDDI